MKQGGIADKEFIRPWQILSFCRGRFLLAPRRKKGGDLL